MSRSVPSWTLRLVACPSIVLVPATLLNAQAPLPTPQELDQLLAPVALYPDALLAQITTASTNPQEILDVDNWLHQNPGLYGPALTDAAQAQGFDPAFLALVSFPAGSRHDGAEYRRLCRDRRCVRGQSGRGHGLGAASAARSLRRRRSAQQRAAAGPDGGIKTASRSSSSNRPIPSSSISRSTIRRSFLAEKDRRGRFYQLRGRDRFGRGPRPSHPWGWGGWGWNWGRKTVLYNRSPGWSATTATGRRGPLFGRNRRTIRISRFRRQPEQSIRPATDDPAPARPNNTLGLLPRPTEKIARLAAPRRTRHKPDQHPYGRTNRTIRCGPLPRPTGRRGPLAAPAPNPPQARPAPVRPNQPNNTLRPAPAPNRENRTPSRTAPNPPQARPAPARPNRRTIRHGPLPRPTGEADPSAPGAAAGFEQPHSLVSPLIRSGITGRETSLTAAGSSRSLI